MRNGEAYLTRYTDFPSRYSLATSITLSITLSVFLFAFLCVSPPCPLRRVEKFWRGTFRAAKTEKQSRFAQPPRLGTEKRQTKGRRNRHDVTARIKAIEINDVKLLGSSFFSGFRWWHRRIETNSGSRRSLCVFVHRFDDGFALKLETHKRSLTRRKCLLLYFTYDEIKCGYFFETRASLYSFLKVVMNDVYYNKAITSVSVSIRTISHGEICKKGDSQSQPRASRISHC